MDGDTRHIQVEVWKTIWHKWGVQGLKTQDIANWKFRKLSEMEGVSKAQKNKTELTGSLEGYQKWKGTARPIGTRHIKLEVWKTYWNKWEVQGLKTQDIANWKFRKLSEMEGNSKSQRHKKYLTGSLQSHQKWIRTSMPKTARHIWLEVWNIIRNEWGQQDSVRKANSEQSSWSRKHRFMENNWVFLNMWSLLRHILFCVSRTSERHFPRSIFN